VEQAHSSGSKEKWTDFGHILMEEPVVVARLDMGYERQKGVKDCAKSLVLNNYGSQLRWWIASEVVF
jgi:hypothetical protein